MPELQQKGRRWKAERERGGEEKRRVKGWKRGKEKRGGRGRSIEGILRPPTKGYRRPPLCQQPSTTGGRIDSSKEESHYFCGLNFWPSYK